MIATGELGDFRVFTSLSSVHTHDTHSICLYLGYCEHVPVKINQMELIILLAVRHSLVLFHPLVNKQKAMENHRF